MDEQKNSGFQSPVQPQQPVSGSPVQPQQPFGASADQPQQPYVNYAYQQQPPVDYSYQPQQPYGAPTPPPYGYDPNVQQPPYGYAPNGQPPYGAAPYPPQPANTGKATASLVCGIAAIAVFFILPLIGFPLGIILGIVAIVLAGQFIKQNGPFGRAKTGRVCGIVGLVLGIFSLLLTIVVVAFVVMVGNSLYEDPGFSEVIEIIDAEEVYPPGLTPFEDSELAGDVDQITAPVLADFEALAAHDADMLESVGAIVNEGFYEVVGVTLEECGVDPVEYAAAITEGMTYELDDAYFESKDSGVVCVYVSCKDIFAILDSYYDALVELSETPGAYQMSDEEYNKEAGALLMEIIRSAEVVPYCNWAVIDVDLVHGEWAVDEESWDYEMYYMFSLA